MILQSQIPLYSKKHWLIISRSRKSQLGDFGQYPWRHLACKLKCALAYCVFTPKAEVQPCESPQMGVARNLSELLLCELAVCVVTVRTDFCRLPHAPFPNISHHILSEKKLIQLDHFSFGSFKKP